MPKLDSNVAAEVDKAESGNALIEEGEYEMVLTAVSAQDKQGKPLMGPKGAYWNWEYTMPEDAERYKKFKVWDITSLSDVAFWKLKQVYDAFGVGADVDTDDLIGKRVTVKVVHRSIQSGARAGDIVAGVGEVKPLAGTAKGAGAGKGKAKADLF